ETRAANIIEFGRMVHAEMNALMDTARRGVSTDGSWLYCTTFPCHMCARHILSAGVERVIYIEPYPKSLAKELYKDEISVDGDPSSKNAVRFEAFVGVAPRRYIHAFDMEMMPKRKNSDTGERCDWMPSAAQFKSRIVNKLYLDGELRIVGYVGKSMRSLIRFNSTRGGRN
ncbi:deaminase, partial [Vineibacter terrae]|uniref:deaminase n=1 Tax=Vineibacter terrae TaxID=2586908 RepID=UPI002E34830D